MRARVSALILATLVAACRPGRPVVTPPAPAATKTFDIRVRGFDGRDVERIAGRLERFDGRAAVECPPATAYALRCTLPADLDYGAMFSGVFSGQGYGPLTQVIVATLGAELAVALPSAHFDPSGIALEQLARIRGAMWSSRMALPYGPRPNRPDNILAPGFAHLYPAETRAQMYAAYTARGYTHGVYGPAHGNDCYHGLWPCAPYDRLNQERWDAILDQLQEAWDHGIAPVFFAHPDNWSFEQTRDELTPYLQQPRAQRLIRILVPAGWEPTGGDVYSWSSCTWEAYARWGRETMPNALILLHNAVKADGAPADAFVGTDSRCDDERGPSPVHAAGGGVNIPLAWSRLQPYVHGWLIQSGPKSGPPSVWNFEPGGAREWGAMFNSGSEGHGYHSIAAHLRAGQGGWPTGSAFPDNRPMLLCAGEETAYTQFWGNEPEAWALAWGDLAMQSGADCYLDGGTFAVGAGPVPWAR